MLLGWRERRGKLLLLLMGLGPLGAGRTRHDERRATDLPVVFVVAAGSGRVGAGDGVVGQVRIVWVMYLDDVFGGHETGLCGLREWR